LFLPRSTAQWVSVDQDNGLPRAMVFVVKLDVARIFVDAGTLLTT
jgi:hypothetical protein